MVVLDGIPFQSAAFPHMPTQNLLHEVERHGAKSTAHVMNPQYSLVPFPPSTRLALCFSGRSLLKSESRESIHEELSPLRRWQVAMSDAASANRE